MYVFGFSSIEPYLPLQRDPLPMICDGLTLWISLSKLSLREWSGHQSGLQWSKSLLLYMRVETGYCEDIAV